MKKVIFNLTDEQNSRLESLARKMGVSKSEAMRRAIELYRMVREARDEGIEFTKRDRQGNERVVEILG